MFTLSNRVLAATLLACCAPAASAGAAPASRSDASVVLALPLSVVKTGDLLFGNIVSGPSAGTVAIDPNSGARTSTGGVTLLGGSYAPASFIGVSRGLSLVYIQLPQVPITLTRVGGSETMHMTSVTVQGSQVRFFVTKQPFTFKVGGTLAVPANQAAGTYVGSFNVTVDYF